MKATNIEWETILTGLIATMKSDVILPTLVGYRAIKNKIAIEDALRPSRASRDDIIMRYSGGSGRVDSNESPELFETVCRELNVIGQEEIEIDISMVELGELPESLPATMITSLSFMVKGD